MSGAAASAQSRSGKVFARYCGPLKSVSLDVATGTITRRPAFRDRAGTTQVDFHNNDLSAFSGVDTGGGFCEWFGAGVKGSLTGDGTANVDSGNVSDLMNSVVFSYCSAKLGPGSGGPGGSVRLGFYEGYTMGGGAATTGVAAFTLTGLPANSASSSFFGSFGCFFMHVTFGTLVSFADGPIGYSWRFLDNGTGTINPQGAALAGTWPFLSCVRSCSGAVGQVDGQGMTDVLDEYCPPGTLRSSFSFGTTSGSFTSMSMQIDEVTDVSATVETFNSSPGLALNGGFPNLDELACTPAIVNTPMTCTVTSKYARPKGGSFVVLYAPSKLSPPCGVPVPQFTGGLNFGTSKNGRMLLITSSGFQMCTGTYPAGLNAMGSCLTQPIPPWLTLVGNPWCSQAVLLGVVPLANGGGNTRLTNGVAGVTGTKFP